MSAQGDAPSQTSSETSSETSGASASDAAIVASANDLPKSKRRFGAIVTTPLLWGFLVAVGLALILVVQMRKNAAPPLPRLGAIPRFELTDQNGAKITGDSFKGKVWIADFIFLGCQASCPKLTARMHDLQQKIEARADLKDAVRFVSFSVDPENDTPPRLHDYAVKFGADESSWRFLTGTNADVESIVVQGFKMQMGKVDDGAGVFTIMHGDWFILVDAKGTIRGYYDSSDLPKMDQILADATRLAGESS